MKVFQWNSNVCFLTCVCLRQRVNNNTMSLFHCCETDRVTSGLKTLYVSFSSNQCQMLPPAPAGCHSTRPWPMRAGLSSSLPPSLQSIRGSVEKRRVLLLSAAPSQSICTSLLLLLPLIVQSCSSTPSSTMERGELLAVCLLCWSCSVCVVTAIQRADMFPYGSLSGDFILAEGDDETSRVLSLPKPLYFYDSLFSQLYVSTASLILICMLVVLWNYSLELTFCRWYLQLMDELHSRAVPMVSGAKWGELLACLNGANHLNREGRSLVISAELPTSSLLCSMYDYKHLKHVSF